MKVMYKKPLVVANDEVAEGVYTASGDDVADSNVCQSQMRKGVWKEAYYSSRKSNVEYSFDGTLTYDDYYACTGCAADVNFHCVLQTGESLRSGRTKLMPTWESKGRAANAPCTEDFRSQII
jgi:hypothetical protein